jgi:hypothetical protein
MKWSFQMNELVTFDFDNARIIHGDIIKFADGRWTQNGLPFNGVELIALGTRRVLQRWHDQELIDCVTEEPLPDVETLNDAIPQSEWSIGLNGEPRKPWELNYIVYFLDPRDASIYTSVNSTLGQKIAYERLSEKIQYMRALRGSRVSPTVALSAAPMKVKRLGGATKMRPDWPIKNWIELGAAQQAEPVMAIGAPVEEPSTKEIVDDDFPF